MAAHLRQAHDRGPLTPLRDGLDLSGMEGACAVLSINTRYWVEGGRRIIGKKIGLMSEAVQKQLGFNQPDFGALFSDMEIADGCGMILEVNGALPRWGLAPLALAVRSPPPHGWRARSRRGASRCGRAI
ncbi:hypothetical protein [Phenylobacterium sp. J367]|uniref:hypothetical protein n=1 Tax=Phenylobacterium sp. J367 TaxID=2898435 RepID=UPI0021508389|nr:hypothetical protein [Phenylobacterium sp. J367]MCR5880236.1 hypothetical protein [Phenylobacterium sp. J367]